MWLCSTSISTSSTTSTTQAPSDCIPIYLPRINQSVVANGVIVTCTQQDGSVGLHLGGDPCCNRPGDPPAFLKQNIQTLWFGLAGNFVYKINFSQTVNNVKFLFTGGGPVDE